MNRGLARRAAAVAVLVAATMTMGLPNARAGGGNHGGGGGDGSVKALTHSGRATVVKADLEALDLAHVKAVVSDTGPLDPSGDPDLHDSLLTVVVGAATYPAKLFLRGEVASAHTAGVHDKSVSSASVATVNLGVGFYSPDKLRIEAAVLRSQAKARCTTAGPVTEGRSQIAALRINGIYVAVTGQPNQEVKLDGIARIVINEQTSNGPGDITVNALHVYVGEYGLVGKLLSGDVVISSAHADVTCPAGPPPPPPPCPSKDFVTGGGYITYGDGTKVTFSTVGGMKPNGLSGHLNVVDHGTGQHVKANDVTGYVIMSPTTRRVVYSGEIDGQPATFTVVVSDNGEPGDADTFSISGGGYSRSGTLGGGNIQIHKPAGCGTAKTKGR